MGLPMFIEPTEPDTASKIAEKSTAAPRSSIRRTRTRGSAARMTHSERRRRMLGMVESSGITDEIDRLRSSYLRPGSDEMTAIVASLPPPDAISSSIDLHDNWSFERQHAPTTDADGPLMPPVPESRDYSATTEHQRDLRRLYQVRQDLRRMARRRPAPTPPYTDTDIAFISRLSSSDPPRQSSSTPRLTPPNEDAAEGSTQTRLAQWDSEISSMQSTRRALSERVATLNRLNNRNMQTSRQLVRQARRLDGLGERLNGLDSRLNGLGDRDRSLSPEGSGAWDILLTSIPPDPQPPSAGSSFASSSASAAAAPTGTNSNTGNSSMTSLEGLDGPVMGDCDIMSDSSSTDFDDEELNALREYASRRDLSRRWRSYADAVAAHEGLGDRAAGDTDSIVGDREAHRIIVRLAARDEIPDEWRAHSRLLRYRPSEPAT
ncbi:hypothetical protein CJF32_00010229 [Rutstroemia sp. NJR-2017a WRK4]|nr:hypothetical protein CJF32_00010229 [Rutstroemia sp. NJR-2017a WRK4]